MKTAHYKFFFTCLLGLATLPARATEIIFESDVQYKRNEQNSFSELKAGQGISVNAGNYLLVKNSKNLPLVVITPGKTNAKVVISDSDFSSLLNLQLQPQLQKATSEIIEGLRQAETLIQKRSLTQANSIVASLKAKYHDIPSLIFMSGTLAYLMNDKATATEELKRGLQLDPSNEPAKKLLKQIQGGT